MQLEFSFDRNECLCTLENVRYYYKRILLMLVILFRDRETFAIAIRPRNSFIVSVHWCLFNLNMYCISLTQRDILSCFAIISLRKRDLVVLMASCGCWSFVTLPSGVVGWSAVCDCAITLCGLTNSTHARIQNVLSEGLHFWQHFLV